MIDLIVRSYFSVLVSIATVCAAIFFSGLYFIFKSYARDRKRQKLKQSIAQHNQEITAIAGDDVIATQLDLARAFIESDKAQAAKKILEMVAMEGSKHQQQEAKELLASI